MPQWTTGRMVGELTHSQMSRPTPHLRGLMVSDTVTLPSGKMFTQPPLSSLSWRNLMAGWSTPQPRTIGMTFPSFQNVSSGLEVKMTSLAEAPHLMRLVSISCEADRMAPQIPGSSKHE